MNFRLFLIGLTLLTVGTPSLYAQEQKTPTVITSDGPLNADFEKKIAVFRDNVLVKDAQGTVNADKMNVYFMEESNQIDKIECYGNVKINHDERYSESQEAIYYATQSKIILKGDPVIRQGNDHYRADVITIFTEQNRVIFEPSAQLLIFPDGEMESKTSFMK